MKPFIQYFCYLLLGLIQIYALLFMWGFSAGPASIAPYIALSCCLGILLVAVPTAIYNEIVAARICLILSAVSIVGASYGAIKTKDASGMVFAFIPILLAIDAVWRLSKPSRISNYDPRRQSKRKQKVIFVLIPYGIIFAWIISII